MDSMTEEAVGKAVLEALDPCMQTGHDKEGKAVNEFFDPGPREMGIAVVKELELAGFKIERA